MKPARNYYFQHSKRDRRMVEDPNGIHAASLTQIPDQDDRVQLKDVAHALNSMTADHRQAILMAADDVPYKIAAHECGIPEGTYKSRVNRARARLMEMCA